MINIHKNNLVLLCTIVLGFLFVVVYVSFPFVVSNEQITKWYIQKFDKNKQKLERIIYECEQIYWKEFKNEQTITMDCTNLPERVKKMIEKENLYSYHITIKKKGEELVIDARFENFYLWQLRCYSLYSPLVLYYESKDKDKKRPENLSTILGNGWSLYKN